MKACKGINKASSFPGCGEIVSFRRFGLCPKCLWEWMSETEEGGTYKKNQFSKKVSKKTKTAINQKQKELKKNYVDWRKKLQSKVQEIARLIDIGQPCLARGNHANQMHGGHVFSRGGNSQIAFNLHNIHRQGAQSNHFQNDDGLLREGLKKEYGEGYYSFVSGLRSLAAIKYSNLEYEAFYREACKICNQLKKDGLVFSAIERIEKRNEINLHLGIYESEFCVYKKQ